MANKRDKIVQKLKDALDEDKALQGDLGIQEVEEILLFLMEETAPSDSVMSEDAKASKGSRDRAGHPEFEANEEEVKKTKRVNKASKQNEHVQPKPGNPEDHAGNVVDESDNADASLGHMNESNPDLDEESVRSRPGRDLDEKPFNPFPGFEVPKEEK